jgi:acyl-coenzyme A synthetase/AMP-(fatty) acid ligase
VSPTEVENVLYALPGVQEAVVIGVPDPILGHAIKAVVALDGRTTLTAADVIRHCARHLEDFMMPKFVEFRDELPKNANGKIARRQVQIEAMEVAQ